MGEKHIMVTSSNAGVSVVSLVAVALFLFYSLSLEMDRTPFNTMTTLGTIQVKAATEEFARGQSELNRLAAERQNFAQLAASLKREVATLQSRIGQVGERHAGVE